MGSKPHKRHADTLREILAVSEGITPAEYEAAVDALDRLLEQFDALDDVLREILDLTNLWSRPLSDRERLEMIDQIATRAVSNPVKRWGLENAVDTAQTGWPQLRFASGRSAREWWLWLTERSS